MKTKQQFIIDTLKPYFLNPDICGYDYEQGICTYKTEDGRKCAVGKHLKDGKWQYETMDAEDLFIYYEMNDILNEGALKQNLTIKEWSFIQSIHDDIAQRELNDILLADIEYLQELTKTNLKELHDLVEKIPYLNETNNN